MSLFYSVCVVPSVCLVGFCFVFFRSCSILYQNLLKALTSLFHQCISLTVFWSKKLSISLLWLHADLEIISVKLIYFVGCGWVIPMYLVKGLHFKMETTLLSTHPNPSPPGHPLLVLVERKKTICCPSCPVSGQQSSCMAQFHCASYFIAFNVWDGLCSSISYVCVLRFNLSVCECLCAVNIYVCLKESQVLCEAFLWESAEEPPLPGRMVLKPYSQVSERSEIRI